MASGLVQVQPDSTGKKIQTFENTVGGNVVEAQAVVLVDPTGAAASQPVSGTVTANQGTAAAVTSGWPIQYQTPTTGALTAASISVAASGDNTLVAGTTAQTVRVFRIFFVVAGAVNIQFKDATGGTALTGVMAMSAGGAFVLDFSGEPWFVTATAGAFVLNLSAAVQVSGRVYYTKS